jgi:putative membrane protein
MMHNWYSPWHQGTAWQAWLLFALLIVIVIAIVVAVVYLVRAPSGAGTASAPQGTAPESPRDILKRRYAAGEIDREEYQQKLEDL